MVPSAKKNIKTFALVMLITGSIDSIRNLPTTALFGSSLVFYLVLSALLFLIPVALVSAELSASFENKGGIYVWVKEAFGHHWGFVAIWLQWINTIVWFPTILSFIAATLTYLINPDLANNKFYMVSIILVTFWFLTLLSLRGIKTSANFVSFCTLVGVLFPMLLIIFLGGLWVLKGHSAQIPLNLYSMLPDVHHSESWISLTAIITAFLGIELSSVHIDHIDKPKLTFPISVFISSILIIATMMLGSLAIAVVIPQKQINLVNGVVEAFHAYLTPFHLNDLMAVMVLVILLGSLGSIVNWVISPAKGLLQASDDGYLPKFFDRYNSYDSPVMILIAQGILVTLVCAAFLLMPSVNGSYWLLTDLSTQLYVLMYLIMFAAAIAIKWRNPNLSTTFNIPGGKWGMYIVSIIGLIGCLIALVVGFFPPTDINVGTPLHYETMFTIGLIAMIIPVFLFFIYKSLGWKKSA